MPWWSWVLIWGGLVVLLVTVLVVGAIWLYRKGASVLAELERLDTLTAAAQEQLVTNQPERHESKAAAMLRPMAEVRADRRTHLRERDSRREARRDARIARAKALIAADPRRYQHLVDARTKEPPCP